MLFTSTLLFSLAATVLARPQDVAPAAAGSKKNIYLATCTSRSVITSTSPQSDIPIQLLTHQATASTAIYYNGPATASTSPTDISVISEPARRWEGATRRTTLDSAKFTSSITDGADSLPKSQIAGTATLGNEEFVCFVDGTSTFTFREGLLGLRKTNCKADYWCASTSVGN
jgi:hypothetical protein